MEVFAVARIAAAMRGGWWVTELAEADAELVNLCARSVDCERPLMPMRVEAAFRRRALYAGAT